MTHKNNESHNEENERVLWAKHAWRYFELHANQRISLIKYYIGIYSLYITASGYILFHDTDVSDGDKSIVLLLSVFIIVITMVFYCLDQRNRDLIHFAEDSLKDYEKEIGFKKPHNIFTIEDSDAKKNYKFRHTHCFNSLFIIGAVTALVLMTRAFYL